MHIIMIISMLCISIFNAQMNALPHDFLPAKKAKTPRLVLQDTTVTAFENPEQGAARSLYLPSKNLVYIAALHCCTPNQAQAEVLNLAHTELLETFKKHQINATTLAQVTQNISKRLMHLAVENNPTGDATRLAQILVSYKISGSIQIHSHQKSFLVKLDGDDKYICKINEMTDLDTPHRLLIMDNENPQSTSVIEHAILTGSMTLSEGAAKLLDELQKTQKMPFVSITDMHKVQDLLNNNTQQSLKQDSQPKKSSRSCCFPYWWTSRWGYEPIN